VGDTTTSVAAGEDLAHGSCLASKIKVINLGKVMDKPKINPGFVC
jgi:hypothetical protein